MITIDDDVKEVDLVIHTNCTSGVDALSNGVPAINLYGNMNSASVNFKNMKALMGPCLDEFPSHPFSLSNFNVLKTSNEIPVNSLDTISEYIIMEADNASNRSAYFRPRLIDLCKLIVRKDRLVSVVSKMVSSKFQIKSVQNQVLQLELINENKI